MKYIFSILFFFFFLLVLLSGITAFSQNVGIGSSTPDASLEINHHSSFQPSIRVIDAANNIAGDETQSGGDTGDTGNTIHTGVKGRVIIHY
jgi:hypothetical protein